MAVESTCAEVEVKRDWINCYTSRKLLILCSYWIMFEKKAINNLHRVDKDK